MTDPSVVSVGRPGVLRRHRRPRVQEDLPGAAGDGEARPPERAGHRRGQGGLEPRAAASARHATASRQHGGVDPAAFDKLVVAAPLRRRRLPRPGDVRSAASRARARPSGRSTTSPSRRACSRPWSSSSARSGCARGARVVVEKPFGRDLASAEALNAPSMRYFPESAIFRIDHYLGKEPVQNLLYFRFANSFLEPIWNRDHVEQRADHHGRELRRRGPRQLLRGDRRDPRRDPEPPAPGRRRSWRWSARRATTPRRSATRRRACSRRSRRSTRTTSCAASSAATATSRASPPIRSVETFAAVRLQIDNLALGRRAVLHPRRQVPAGDLHRGARRAEGAAARRLRREDRSARTTSASASAPTSPSPSACASKTPGEAMVGHEVELLASQGVSDEMDAYERLLGDAMRATRSCSRARTPSRRSGAIVDADARPARRRFTSTSPEAGARPKRTDWSPAPVAGTSPSRHLRGDHREPSELDQPCVNTIRFLSVDMVEKANSGHPGLPMGAAPMAYVLWTRFLRAQSEEPALVGSRPLRPFRGPRLGAALLAAPSDRLRSLARSAQAVPAVGERDARASREPRHRRRRSLDRARSGRASATRVGMAIGEAHLAARYNRPGHEIFHHFTYVLACDGDMMEGVQSEASLARRSPRPRPASSSSTTTTT